MCFKHRGYFTVPNIYVVINLIQCFTDSISSQLGQSQNVSYEWTDDFHVKLTWQKPKGLDSECKVRYRINDTEQAEEIYNSKAITTDNMDPNGWTYQIKIANRSCKLNTSYPVLIIPPPAVLADIQNFTCSFYKHDSMNCSWIPTRHIPDLQVFYRLCSEKHKPIMEADMYKNGCHLKVFEASSNDDFCILLNGTVNGTRVMNTFKCIPAHNVKTPAPTLTINEEGDNLLLSWTPPKLSYDYCWRYNINYNKCDENNKEVNLNGNSHKIPYDKNCLYKVQIKANLMDRCGSGGSDISQVLTYGNQVSLFQSSTIIIIIIPLILSICVILACYCLWRQRDIIFPVIPDPSVIKEMMNRSKEPKNLVGSLYIPEKEDVEQCTVNLLEV